MSQAKSRDKKKKEMTQTYAIALSPSLTGNGMRRFPEMESG